MSIAQNLSRICSNGLFFRKFLPQHFRGLCFGLRALRCVQKHFRKLSRTELISQAFANFPELLQAFANEKFAQSFADPSRLHFLLSRRHHILTSLQIVTCEVLATAQVFWLDSNDKDALARKSKAIVKLALLQQVFGAQPPIKQASLCKLHTVSPTLHILFNVA